MHILTFYVFPSSCEGIGRCACTRAADCGNDAMCGQEELLLNRLLMMHVIKTEHFEDNSSVVKNTYPTSTTMEDHMRIFPFNVRTGLRLRKQMRKDNHGPHYFLRGLLLFITRNRILP